MMGLAAGECPLANDRGLSWHVSNAGSLGPGAGVLIAAFVHPHGVDASAVADPLPAVTLTSLKEQ